MLSEGTKFLALYHSSFDPMDYADPATAIKAFK